MRPYVVCALLFLKACAAQTHYAQLTWGSSPTTGVSYNVKRSQVSGGPYQSLVTGLASTSYKDTTVTANQRYCYVVSATSTLGESANSTEACGTTGKDSTQPPSGTITIIFQ